MADKNETNVGASDVAPVGQTVMSGSQLAKKKVVTSRKRILILLTALVLVGISVGGYITLFKKTQIKIGDSLITDQQIDEYVAFMDEYKKEYPDIDWGGDYRQIAVNDLVMNAALKKEAKSLGVEVKDQDVIKILGKTYTKATNLDSIRRTAKGFVSVTRAENDTYQRALSEKLLIRKDLFMINISWDSPYHYETHDDTKTKKLYGEAETTLNKDFLPLMKSGVHRDKIAKKTDVIIYDKDNKDNAEWEPYFERLVTLADYRKGYLQGVTKFNELKDDQLLGIKPDDLRYTEDEIAKLKKPGDITGVFASRNGNHTIIRLEAVSEGKFNSWEELLESYKKEFNVATSLNLLNDVSSKIEYFSNNALYVISSIGLEKAHANHGCSGHTVNFYGRSYDNSVFGLRIAGTTFSHYRSAHNCGSAYTGTKTRTTVTSNPSAHIIDNCYGPAPTWTLISHPSGYNYTGQGWNDGVWGGAGGAGWPVWSTSTMNTVGTIYIDFYYNPADQAPIGDLNVADCGQIAGWAFDPDRSGQSINVHIYIDGTYVGQVNANTSRPDVNSFFGISGNHGFSIDMNSPPWSNYKNTSSHTVRVYALGITSGGAQNGNNREISNSPKTFGPCIGPVTCSPASQTITQGGSASFSASGGTGTFSWSAPGGSPSSGSGGGFSTSYSTAGSRTVTVTSGSQSGSCTVTVNPPPSNCPAYSSPIFTVSLPNAGKAHGSSSSPPSYSLSPGQTYHYTTYTSTTRINPSYGHGVEDISAHESPEYNVQIDYTGGTNNSVDLNYTKFWDRYYYDRNQARVHYQAQYRDRHYRSSSTPTSTHDHNGDGDTNDYHERHYGYSYVSRSDSEELQWGTDQHRDGPNTVECDTRKFEFDTPDIGNIDWDDNEEPTHITVPSETEVTYKANTANKHLRYYNKVNNVPVEMVMTYYDKNGNVKAGMTATYLNPSSSAGPGCSSDDDFTSPYPVGRFDTPNSGYTIDTGWDSDDSRTVTSTDCWRARIPPLQAGDYACVTVALQFTRGEMNRSGTYSSTSNPVISPNDPIIGKEPGDYGCTEQLHDKPYFTVTGGKVLAGSGFKVADGSCTPTTGSRIEAWNRASKAPDTYYGNSRYGGSGAQLAALALDAINEFASASARGSNPVAPRGLSFGNTSGTWGGYWSPSNINCMENFFHGMTGTAYTSGTALNSLDGTYQASGNVRIPASVIPNSRRITLFVNGDVQIDGNITNASAAYTKVEDIPSLRIIARNIFIRHNVTEVRATLIAQNSTASNGNIYTCTSPAANFTVPTNAELGDGGCRSNNLEIFGSLSARKIFFLRTIGSIRNSNVGDDYAGDANNTVAERIIFSPSSWLANPSYDSTFKPPYQASTSLPPLL
jgi:hypothetical protein